MTVKKNFGDDLGPFSVEYFSLGTLAENALPAASSASCYCFAEDIRIIPVVMSERKLSKI
jgi:hypothetical protein